MCIRDRSQIMAKKAAAAPKDKKAMKKTAVMKLKKMRWRDRMAAIVLAEMQKQRKERKAMKKKGMKKMAVMKKATAAPKGTKAMKSKQQ